MDLFLDFEECIKDSPAFRLSLEQRENDVSDLESRVAKVMKLCSRTVEAGQTYNTANQLLLSALMDFSQYHQKDNTVMNCLQQFNQGLQEMIHFHTMLFDQIQRAVNQQLTNLLTQFLPQVRDTRREFLRIGEDLDTAIMKNAQVPRHKPMEAERAGHLLLATRKCYQHFTLDYCLQLNNFKAQQKLDILNSIFSYVHAHYTFFHQGYDLFRDLDSTMRTMATKLAQQATECAAKKKEMENTHLLVQQRDASGELRVTSCPSNRGTIEGYLFKRSHRKNKTWKRCWFSTENSQLVYTKSHKAETRVLFDDLRLCAVKSVDNERCFSFQVVSVQKSCFLQAESEELRRAWVTAVQDSIDMAYRQRVGSQQLLLVEGLPSAQSPSATLTPPVALGEALHGPGNQHCCDCGASEPRWASLNLGVTMCIECSGIHRSLGVHLSKVRSLTLDSWDPEQLKLLCILGNDVINRIYEAQAVEHGREKPRADSLRLEKETWIKDKYVEKRFVIGATSPHGEGRHHAGQLLYRATLQGDLVSMATALAQGAEVNWSNPEEEGRTALIGAAYGGSLLACEFLLQNGANVNYRDQRGHAALHAAATCGHTGQVCLLLKRGANQYSADERGRDPLSIAMETAHADIVTLLRMARMNEEMKDSEGLCGTLGDDETFQDIVRDFSNMASHDPDSDAEKRERFKKIENTGEMQRVAAMRPASIGGEEA